MMKYAVSLFRIVVLLLGFLLVSMQGQAGEVKLFPVKEVFYDDSAKSPLDQQFLAAVRDKRPALVKSVYDSLTKAFASRVGPLNSNTMNDTFAISFHVIRASSYLVDKGNGNSDVVAALTASLNVTNMNTGETLTTFTETGVSRTTISNSDDAKATRTALFTGQLQLVTANLIKNAVEHFKPITLDTRVVDQVGDLLILDSGYLKGVQAKDVLSGPKSERIEVLSTFEGYSVAEKVLADNVKSGDVYQKIMFEAADGKIKPPALVVTDSLLPAGYTSDYVKQIFSDVAGSNAPFKMIKVNGDFANLTSTVLNESGLSRKEVSNRQPPTYFIRLRVGEPIIYEVGTNLDYKKIRHYETFAFADVLDNTGRVNFSVVGKDEITDEITRNIGPGIQERREVSIKNALNNLAEQLAKSAQLRREQTQVVSAPPSEIYIAGVGKVFPEKQNGMLLHKFKVQFGKEVRELQVPLAKASVDMVVEGGKVRLNLGAPVGQEKFLTAGDFFEVERMGPTPRSANTMQVCGPSENLGSIATPFFQDISRQAISNRMPGMLYVKNIKDIVDQDVSEANNFAKTVPWQFPNVVFCVQPVERVNQAEDVCSNGQCERPLTARYTLRVKVGTEIWSRTGLESEFKSTGFYKQGTSAIQIKNLIDADLIDEARLLLDKVAEKLTFVKQ